MSNLETTPSSEGQVEQLLEKALILIELTIDLKEKSHIGEKYACDLKSLAWKACQITSAIQQSTKEFLQLAENIVKSALEIIANDRKNSKSVECKNGTCNSGKETEEGVIAATDNVIEAKETKDHTDLIYKELVNLQNILKKDIQLHEKSSEMKLSKTKSSTSIADLIKTLQIKQQKRKDNLSPRICKDEKYPERTSRESLLDQANLSLQTVHEDSFTDFNQLSSHDINSKTQNSVLSLKAIRRIKRYLQHKSDFDSELTEPGYPETSNLGDLVRNATESQSRLIQSLSINSMTRDSEAILKNESSHVNIILHNISEED
ncbi:uncharacterized protein LOC103506217 [Diaphorina citri]|uniref:Uncharacterized protein LOC103506217 n=1 Tax=Diaphorina citri TaxID=121845 RepID=A0A1S3CVS2_DIACI|nr:uncharacterized protein LOC103506217 [Diaphorina citri]KAI5711208.1 hypothetical protein M8J75_015092 [Diaphorina citri]KAI5752025.1 hypothetical protein M8J77_013027 [Diaphorina citri]